MKLSLRDIELLTVINRLDRSLKARAYAALLRADDLEFSYSEVCQSFNNLLSCGLIKQTCGKFFGESVVITAKGKAVIAYNAERKNGKAANGKEISEEEFEITLKRLPFSEEEWNWAISGLQEESRYFSSPVKQSKQYVVSKWKPIFAVICWLLSLACLATGITFACLPWVIIGWRVGAPLLGVFLYGILGMVSCGFVSSRVKYGCEKFISIVCLPSLGLCALFSLLGY